MSKSHIKTRQTHYAQRAHDAGLRDYRPSEGVPLIGLWGEGVNPIAQRPDAGLTQGPRVKIQRHPDGTLTHQPRSKGFEGK